MIKRVISFLSVLCLSAASVGLPQINAETIMSGDVNSDGKINEYDLISLQKYILGENTKVSDVDLCADGVVDIFDLNMLRKTAFVQEKFPVVINEVCASNKNSYKDKNGKSPDWIELYNNSSEIADISGFGLSDGNKNRYKFVFPKGTVIKPESCIIVLCDGEGVSVDNQLCAKFKISSEETIYLTASQKNDGTNGTDIDSLNIPESEADVSYGRYSDGSDNLVFLTPTPNASNNTAEQVYKVDAPDFSHNAGFYDEAFSLELSASDENRILYTLDGSDPKTSDTAKKYSKAIQIYDNTSEENRLINQIVLDGIQNEPSAEDVDKGFVVKAVCQDKNGEFGRVVSNSYFVGKTAEFYKNMKVVSMSIDEADLFDEETGLYVYDNLWCRGKEWERPANIQVFEEGKPEYSENIGVRIGGNSSRDCMQKTFTFFARSEYGKSKMKYEWIDGLKDINGKNIKEFDKITLRNSSDDWYSLKIRDTLLQGLVDDRSLSVQGQKFCTLFINGEFWGLYTITEKFDENYIESHYNIDKNDCTLYEIWNDVNGSEKLLDEYKEFFEWAVNADMTKKENYQKVCETIDIQNLADYVAFQTYICNIDWMSGEDGNISNNWSMWRSDSVNADVPYNDGKWRFMVYDTERAASLMDDFHTAYDYDLLGKMDRTGLYLNISNVFYNLMNNTDFRTFFYDNYISMIENNFAPDRVNEMITEMSELTEKAAMKTNECFSNSQSNEQYEHNLDVLREFFEKRPEYAKKYLDNLMNS